MKPRLKEDPREWRKFAWAALAALTLVAGLLWRRGTLPPGGFLAVAGTALVLGFGAALWPQPIRPVYRVAMTGGYYVGQGMGRVLLALAFVLVLIPLGLLLRLARKDLLRLRSERRAASHWRPARFSSHFDRQF